MAGNHQKRFLFMTLLLVVVICTLWISAGSFADAVPVSLIM